MNDTAERQRMKQIQSRLTSILTKIEQLSDLISGWQDPDRIYTPAEQQLAVRLDRCIAPG